MINSKSLIPVRIGALLISAEIIKAKDLVEALKEARILNKPLGEILVKNELVTAEIINSAIEAQKLLRLGNITMEIAQLALKMSATNNLPLEEALKVLGWQNECFTHFSNTRLERLLLVSEAVNKQQLDQAIWNSSKSGLPLGRILVLMGITSPSILLNALHALLHIRHNKIAFEDAVQGLKYVLSTGSSLEEALSIESSEPIQIGELLTGSSVMSTSDVAHAIELGLQNQKPMVHVLIESGLANEQVVEAAMKLQKKVRQGQLSLLHASEILRRVDAQGISAEDLLSRSNSMKEAVIALIKKAELIAEGDLEKFVEENEKYKNDKIEALCQSGLVSQGRIRVALRSAISMLDGNLSMEQAVESIKSFQEGKLKTTAQHKVKTQAAEQEETADVQEEKDFLLGQTA